MASIAGLMSTEPVEPIRPLFSTPTAYRVCLKYVRFRTPTASSKPVGGLSRLPERRWRAFPLDHGISDATTPSGKEKCAIGGEPGAEKTSPGFNAQANLRDPTNDEWPTKAQSQHSTSQRHVTHPQSKDSSSRRNGNVYSVCLRLCHNANRLPTRSYRFVDGKKR